MGRLLKPGPQATSLGVVWPFFYITSSKKMNDHRLKGKLMGHDQKIELLLHKRLHEMLYVSKRC